VAEQANCIARAYLLDPVHNAIKRRFCFLLTRDCLQLPILLQCVCVVGVGMCKADTPELCNSSLNLPQRSCKCGPCCKQLLLHNTADGFEVLAADTLQRQAHNNSGKGTLCRACVYTRLYCCVVYMQGKHPNLSLL
jgi:hypothetical protein